MLECSTGVVTIVFHMMNIFVHELHLIVGLIKREDAPCVVLLDLEGCTSSKLSARLDSKEGVSRGN